MGVLLPLSSKLHRIENQDAKNYSTHTRRLRLQILTAMFRTNLLGDEYVNAGGLREVVSADDAQYARDKIPD